MPAKKNQHFVPRCHLKPFTLDGAGVAINVYHHPSNQGIPNAPVKGQCARDYFYGKDLVIENFLQDLEGGYATTIAKLVGDQTATVYDDDLRKLREFAYLQLSRTENAIKRRTAIVQGMDALTHQGFEEFRKENANVSQDFMVVSAMKTYFETVKNIGDLDVVLLRNKTHYDFVTSDDPAILTNRLFMQRLQDVSFGLVAAGTQLLMPLTPKLALVCYDKSTYSAPNRRGRWIDITRDADVRAMNELQYISCASNIYFRDWAQLERVKHEFAEAADRRPQGWYRSFVMVQVYENEKGEFYRRATDGDAGTTTPRVISHSPIHAHPSRWLSELVYRPKVFAYSNGSAVRFVREGQVARFSAHVGFVRQEVKPQPPPDPLGPKTAWIPRRAVEPA